MLVTRVHIFCMTLFTNNNIKIVIKSLTLWFHPTPPAPQMKETLKSRFGDKISNILPNEGLDDSSYKAKLKEIHTKEVKSSIQQLGDNQILQRPPPNINES